MTAQNQDIATLTAGDDLIIEVTVEDESGSAIDITGASFEYGIAAAAGESTLVTKSSNSGISIVDAAAGRVDITLNASDTEQLDRGHYHHELEMTASDGDVSTVFVGTVGVVSDTV